MLVNVARVCAIVARVSAAVTEDGRQVVEDGRQVVEEARHGGKGGESGALRVRPRLRCWRAVVVGHVRRPMVIRATVAGVVL